jgi:hypothetical protein
MNSLRFFCYPTKNMKLYGRSSLKKWTQLCNRWWWFKWVIISKAQNCDTELISLLLENPEIKTHFFIPIKDILVLTALFINLWSKKTTWTIVLLPIKNKIGLTIDGKFLNQRNEVALVWPYKDCILEGGQSREEDNGKKFSLMKFWRKTKSTNY